MRTSGKVLKDFENLRKALFDEEISHMAFMRDGKVEILYTQKYVDKLEDQLQQKENIIKEVRELVQRYNILVGYYDGYECYDGTYDTYSHDTVKEELLEILDKKEVN